MLAGVSVSFQLQRTLEVESSAGTGSTVVFSLDSRDIGFYLKSWAVPANSGWLGGITYIIC